jgi:hypothetical protein
MPGQGRGSTRDEAMARAACRLLALLFPEAASYGSLLDTLADALPRVRTHPAVFSPWFL